MIEFIWFALFCLWTFVVWEVAEAAGARRGHAAGCQHERSLTTGRITREAHRKAYWQGRN